MSFVPVPDFTPREYDLVPVGGVCVCVCVRTVWRWTITREQTQVILESQTAIDVAVCVI